jgi:hypothetical protein
MSVHLSINFRYGVNRRGERVIVSAQITTTEHEQLLRMAKVADWSLSAEIRRALRWYFARQRARGARRAGANRVF